MGKRALLAKYLQDIRASYCFLPMMLALLAVILARAVLLKTLFKNYAEPSKAKGQVPL